MIPQFKPFKEGSIWYNMEARSYGETVRDEDAFNLAVFRESADIPVWTMKKNAILKAF